MIILFSELKV